MNLLQRIWFKAIKEWWQLTVPVRLRIKGVNVGERVLFYGMPIVSMVEGSSISIGDRVTLCSDSRFTALGINHPVVLRTLRLGAKIVIGEDSGISGGSICAAVSILVGRECLLGANVSITDTDFHALQPIGRRYNNNPLDISAAPVNIEDNVFIGMGATVLKGVTIGKNSVIGAMSVVSRDVVSDIVVAGVPARSICKTDPS